MLSALATHPALAGMRALRQWIVYRLEPSTERLGKLDKRPIDPRTRRLTRWSQPANWLTAEEAVAAALELGPARHGAGFVFTPDCGFWFIDVDSAVEGGNWSAAAQEVWARFPGAAFEISRSKTGFHLFGRGTIPAHSCRADGAPFELYHQARFAALTGDALQGSDSGDHSDGLAWIVGKYFRPCHDDHDHPVPVEGPRADWCGPADDGELLGRMLAAQPSSARDRFDKSRVLVSNADLYHANERVLALAYPSPKGDVYDRSKADFALAWESAYYYGCDVARIERMMRSSPLRRDKWDDRPDYLIDHVIIPACRNRRTVLQDKRPEPGPAGVVVGDAPTMTPVVGETMLNAEAQAAHFKGCVYIVDSDRVLVPGGKLLRPNQFKAVYGGRTFVMDRANTRTTRNAFEAFTESQLTWSNSFVHLDRGILPRGRNGNERQETAASV